MLPSESIQIVPGPAEKNAIAAVLDEPVPENNQSHIAENNQSPVAETLPSRAAGTTPGLPPGQVEVREAQHPETDFVAALKRIADRYNLATVSEAELLVGPNFKMIVSEADIKKLCTSTPYDELYTHKIKWSAKAIASWERRGKPHHELPTDCIITDHPNRLKGIRDGHISANEPPDYINPLTQIPFEVDSAGHPLHPHWRQLLKYGIAAGPGFFYREGNVGNVKGEEAAQDPIIFRVQNLNGTAFLQIFVGVRVDDVNKTAAFLGGIRDQADTQKRGISSKALKALRHLTAIREAHEEGGIDLMQAPYLPILTTEVLDPRITLNTFMTTHVAAFLLEGNVDVKPNSAEVDKVEWVTVTQQLIHSQMFANHGQLLQATLKKIYQLTGLGVTPDGQLVRTTDSKKV